MLTRGRFLFRNSSPRRTRQRPYARPPGVSTRLTLSARIDFESVRELIADARKRFSCPVKPTFLGTRAEINARTRRHRMHSSLLVSYRDASVMIDCGLDWLGKFERLHPNAIVLTHAHPDHAWGLRDGAHCPLHAPQKTWRTLKNCHIEDRHLIKERKRTEICGITFEAFPVEHSIL